MALVKSSLPKSRSGRQPAPLDMELVEEIIAALKAEPVVDGRPAAYGPDSKFDTEGKASAHGRRHANAVQDALKKTVRVNAYQENGNANSPWLWRAYIPLAVSQDKKPAAKK